MMKKLLFVGACALALSATGAMAQTPEAQSSSAPSMRGGMKPGADTMHKGTGKTSGQTTGMSRQDRATVPGSKNAGGTSPAAPNTAQPNSSKTGGSQ
ncbi:hypothetical protein [Bradyrhizobium sp. SYSU BS000235]|uniref:hypothetical protein n=1 Tax=Bradyrhizobium sp. SYSU BS000235 TaxID=3411332 RepID=UPI003C78A182